MRPLPPRRPLRAAATSKPVNLVSMPAPMPLSTPEDDERLTREEIIRARNAAQNALATSAG